MVKVTVSAAVCWGSPDSAHFGEEGREVDTAEFESLTAFSRRFLRILRSFRAAEDGETVCLRVRLGEGQRLLKMLNRLARIVKRGRIRQFTYSPDPGRLLFELLDGKVIFEETFQRE